MYFHADFFKNLKSVLMYSYQLKQSSHPLDWPSWHFTKGNMLLSLLCGEPIVGARWVSKQASVYTRSTYYMNQERSQKGDSGCAPEKLGVPHLLSD